MLFWRFIVVYLLTPTSNHNYFPGVKVSVLLYIFWLLHQTTTVPIFRTTKRRCISFDSYIKPQLNSETFRVNCVVYLLTPTSNHNLGNAKEVGVELYIFWLLHQTTTLEVFCIEDGCCISFDSYIKPQLARVLIWGELCCISFDSYIKPQHHQNTLCQHFVVYLLT